jgi:hypothetical protein
MGVTFRAAESLEPRHQVVLRARARAPVVLRVRAALQAPVVLRVLVLREPVALLRVLVAQVAGGDVT